MNATMRHLTEIMTCCIGLGHPPSVQPADWSHWMHLVSEHQLGPFLASRAKPLHKDWPDHICEELHMQHMGSCITTAARVAEQCRVLRHLGGSLNLVVLKGAALTWTLYPSMAERMMGDLDVLCESETDVQRATDMLLRLGYRPARALPGHHHAAPLTHPFRPLTVELHRNLTTPGPSTAFLEGFRATSQTITLPNRDVMTVPDNLHMLIHLCLHALVDPIDSPLLRHLFEIAWLAARLSDDEQKQIVHLTRQHGLETPVARALALARHYFTPTPRLLEPPRKGTFEYWAHRRMHWTSETRTRNQSLLRHLAVKQFDHFPDGRWSRDGLRLLAILWRAFINPVKRRLVILHKKLRQEPWCRGPYTACGAGEGMLLLDDNTGTLHLLSGAAAEAWLALDQPLGLSAWRVTLGKRGIKPRMAKQAVAELIRREIVHSSHRAYPAANGCDGTGATGDC